LAGRRRTPLPASPEELPVVEIAQRVGRVESIGLQKRPQHRPIGRLRGHDRLFAPAEAPVVMLSPSRERTLLFRFCAVARGFHETHRGSVLDDARVL